jgi:hypothetical protein
MAFKYACFVSYCHGRYDLVRGFMEQLQAALKAALETRLDEEMYIDTERLRPGFRYNEELARAICQSVCMVVVYWPTYERHAYCMREFAGMEELEEKRRRLLGPLAERLRGLIIPIILRGSDDVPDRIRRHRHYADFSRFTLASPEIKHHPEYAAEIKKIAEVIHEQYKYFAGHDPCSICQGFQLPPESEVPSWRPQFVNR